MSGGGIPAWGSVHLLLFSRVPVPGKTKTRLIPALGAGGARDFHVACLNDLLAMARQWRDDMARHGRDDMARHGRDDMARQARDATARRRDGSPPGLHLFITPPGSQAAFRMAGVNWPNDFALHNQQGDTLGERMADAMQRVQLGRPRPCAVLLVGSDLPLLTAGNLDDALASLADADVVFGPTADGGYYLVGLRFPDAREVPGELFDVSGWGGGDVLAQSLEKAESLGLSAATIGALPDADTPDDLEALLGHPLAGRFRNRASLRFLRSKGLGGGPDG